MAHATWGRSCAIRHICDTRDIRHICDVCDIRHICVVCDIRHVGHIGGIGDIRGLWRACDRPDACSGRAVSNYEAGEMEEAGRQIVRDGWNRTGRRAAGSGGLGTKVLAEDLGTMGQWANAML